VLKINVLCVTNDSIEEYIEVGYSIEERQKYFNPCNCFDEVHLLYHYAKTDHEIKHGFFLHKRSGFPFIRELMMIYDGVRIVKNHDIDIIRAYNPFRAGFIGVIASWISDKPVVVSLHNDYSKLWKVKKINPIMRLFLEIIERFVLFYADNVWCVTSYLQEYALKRFASVPILMPNKVELGVFNNKNDKNNDRFTMIYVGRIEKQKNVDTLLKACEHFGDDIHLIIIGKDQTTPDEKHIIDKIKNDKNIRYIEYADHDTELPKLFMEADCFCLPSFTEGFGICCHPETKVYTDDGVKFVKLIPDVKVGDMVLTHKGRFKKVISVGKREIKENIKVIKSGYSKTLKVTFEHQVYVVKQCNLTLVKAKDLKEGDMLFPSLMEFLVTDEFYEGLVYNLQVEDDESYTTMGGCVHNCLIEAQASGLPIICSDIPEVKDIVTKDNALLFDPYDADDLIKKIIIMRQDKMLRENFGKLSLESAKKFDWDVLSKKESESYKYLVDDYNNGKTY